MKKKIILAIFYSNSKYKDDEGENGLKRDRWVSMGVGFYDVKYNPARRVKINIHLSSHAVRPLFNNPFILTRGRYSLFFFEYFYFFFIIVPISNNNNNIHTILIYGRVGVKIAWNNYYSRKSRTPRNGVWIVVRTTSKVYYNLR